MMCAGIELQKVKKIPGWLERRMSWIQLTTKPKDDESTCRTYTGFLEELEYLKIETRLIDEKFASVMGECVI